MAVLEVHTWPSKELETKSEDVKVFDDKFRAFVADLHETMDKRDGIGLAANQVGVLQRVFVIHIPYFESKEYREEKKWWHNKRFTLVNPIITKKNGKMRMMEGCLSFPDLYEYVDRADTIEVKFQDEFGKEHTVEADELFSACIQHENDHIDGIVFINRLSRLKLRMIKKKLNHLEQMKLSEGSTV